MCSQPGEIASGVGLLLRDVRNSTVGRGDGPPAHVVVLPPPSVSAERLAVRFKGFLPRAEERAREVGRLVREMVAQEAAAFRKLGMQVAVADISEAKTGLDGLHFTAAGSRAVGAIVAKCILTEFQGFPEYAKSC